MFSTTFIDNDLKLDILRCGAGDYFFGFFDFVGWAKRSAAQHFAEWRGYWASLRSAEPTGGGGIDLWFLVKNRRWPNVCMESLDFKNHEN